MAVFLLSILLVACIDISLARARYVYHLYYSVRPVKHEMQLLLSEFHDKVPEHMRNCTESMDCTCEMNALTISAHRQEILYYIRDQHAVAHQVSLLFDSAREVNQETKVKSLFERKSCKSIIASSDKTNIYMDMVAIFLALKGLVILRKLLHLIGYILQQSRLL